MEGEFKQASVPAVGEADVSPSNICQIGWGGVLGVSGLFIGGCWSVVVSSTHM